MENKTKESKQRNTSPPSSPPTAAKTCLQGGKALQPPGVLIQSRPVRCARLFPLLPDGVVCDFHIWLFNGQVRKPASETVERAKKTNKQKQSRRRHAGS